VQLGEGDVLRSELERQKEVPQRRGNGGEGEEEDHHHAVQREELVVGLLVEELSAGQEELEPDEQREQAADQEEGQRADQIHQADALVVDGERPGLEALAGVQIVLLRKLGSLGSNVGCGTHLAFLTRRGPDHFSVLMYSMRAFTCRSLSCPL